MASGAELTSTGRAGPDTASLTPDHGWSDPGQGRNDREAPDRATRAVEMASPSRRPWAITLLAVLIIAGTSALTGWQTRWPEAVFGVQKTAVIKPAPPRTVAPPTGQAPASTPDSFAPGSGAAALPQTPESGAASADASDPASVVDAYFAAINAHDYTEAWALGGSNSGSSSYSQFVSGFATTSNDAVTVLSTSGDVATAQLVAQQDDGSTKTFTGTYTVVGGVITAFHVEQTG
jgi:hypothetical protein